MERKITTDGPAYGLVMVEHDSDERSPYQADGLTEELEQMLAQGWTVRDPAALDKLGLGHLVEER